MDDFLRARLSPALAAAVAIAVRAIALVLIVLLADSSLGEFDYFRLGR